MPTSPALYPFSLDWWTDHQLVYLRPHLEISDERLSSNLLTGALILIFTAYPNFIRRCLYSYCYAWNMDGVKCLGYIIPNQRKMLNPADQPVDYSGEQAKYRSVHNNYFTLPLFSSSSNHYPMTFGHDFSWVIIVSCLLWVLLSATTST